MQIIFDENVTYSEREFFRIAFKEAHQKYEILSGIKVRVLYSNHMKKTLGRCSVKRREPLDYTIKLSALYRKQGGLENIGKTLRHEIAHIVDYRMSNTFSHGYDWAKVCKDLNGSMNEDQAYGEFKECLYDIKDTKFPYVYTCSCGRCTLRRFRKISMKVLTGHVCKHCKAKVSTFNLTVYDI